MVWREAAEGAVRYVVEGPDRGDLLFFLGEQTDDDLSQWRIRDTDGNAAIAAFVKRKAQGALLRLRFLRPSPPAATSPAQQHQL